VASGKMENGKWPGLSGTKDGKIAAWHAFQLKKWPTSDSSLNGCPGPVVFVPCQLMCSIECRKFRNRKR